LRIIRVRKLLKSSLHTKLSFILGKGSQLEKFPYYRSLSDSHFRTIITGFFILFLWPYSWDYTYLITITSLNFTKIFFFFNLRKSSCLAIWKAENPWMNRVMELVKKIEWYLYQLSRKSQKIAQSKGFYSVLNENGRCDKS